MTRLAVVLVLAAAGCNKRQDPPPPPAAKVTTTSPPTPVEPPLDPVRVTAEQANRAALELVKRAAPCPQQLPSVFVRYCRAADDFARGNIDALAEGDTVLVGEMTIIQPGAPSFSTIGTGIPVAFLLRRTGHAYAAKQVVLQGDNDVTATLVGRIGKTIDGVWDHVDVPAAFADKIASLPTLALDPLDVADGALWPHDLDGMEMRRANGRWLLVGSPEGPEGRHVIGIFVDNHKVLGPKEKSPQKITVVHM